MPVSLVVMMTIGVAKIPSKHSDIFIPCYIVCLFLFLTIHAVNSALGVWFVCVSFVLEPRDSDYLSPFS